MTVRPRRSLYENSAEPDKSNIRHGIAVIFVAFLIGINLIEREIKPEKTGFAEKNAVPTERGEKEMRDTIIFLGGIIFMLFGLAAMGLYAAWRERRR